MEGYGLIFIAIILTVLAQLVMKWQVGLAGPAPDELQARILYFVRVLMSPWVIAAFAAAFGVALAWILILNKYELSWAYPFMSLTFPLVVFSSALLFQEQLSWLKVFGVSLIVVGVALQAMG